MHRLMVVVPPGPARTCELRCLAREGGLRRWRRERHVHRPIVVGPPGLAVPAAPAMTG